MRVFPVAARHQVRERHINFQVSPQVGSMITIHECMIFPWCFSYLNMSTVVINKQNTRYVLRTKALWQEVKQVPHNLCEHNFWRKLVSINNRYPKRILLCLFSFLSHLKHAWSTEIQFNKRALVGFLTHDETATQYACASMSCTHVCLSMRHRFSCLP